MTTKKDNAQVATVIGTLLLLGGGLAYMARQAPNLANRANVSASHGNALYEGKPASASYIASLDVIKNMRIRAEKQKEMGQDGEREATMRRAVDITATDLGPMHKEVAESLDQLGKFLSDKNRYSEALPFLRRAYDIRQKGESEYCDKNAYTGSLLAECLMNLKNYPEADELYKRIIEFYKQSDQDGFSEGQQRAIENLANSLRWQERYKEALALEEEEIATLKKAPQANGILMASAYAAAADTAQDANDAVSAKKYLALASETLNAATKNDSRTRAEVFGQMADIDHELKLPRDEMVARENCDANYEAQAAFLDDDQKGDRAENLMKAGACAIVLKDPTKATAFYQKALDQSNKDAVVHAKLLEHKDWLRYFLTASKSQTFKGSAKALAAQIKLLIEG
jgi:tetratricopeptide (TPR) repeat protein